MFKDTLDGQTHYYNDGCGCPEHNNMPDPTQTKDQHKDYSTDTCDKHNKVDCMECFYTTRAEMPTKDWEYNFIDIYRGGTYEDEVRFIKTLLAEKDKEIVICSAVKTTTGKIFRGHRHGDCMRAIQDRHLAVGHSPEDQGFITSLNRYVNRKEAYDIQINAGIKSINPDGYCEVGQLYSEDLY
jgi:hypothetical protein